MSDPVRTKELASLRAFIERHAHLLTGNVLDYGCGRQPYRDIVEAAGGTYTGYDRERHHGALNGVGDVGPDRPLAREHEWTAIMAMGWVQYEWTPEDIMGDFFDALVPGGHVLLTSHTSWPEVEPYDLCRLTVAGARFLLESVGFVDVHAESRAKVTVNHVDFSLGFGAVGRKP